MATATLNMTSFDAALKVHYTKERIKNLVYKKQPTLALLPKMTSFGGKHLVVPVQFGDPTGRSSTFATAQANKRSSDLDDFVITRVKDYGLASVDNETLKASVGNEEAFMRAATTEIDGVMNALSRSLGSAIFRSGTGSIGQVHPTAAITTDLTLANREDVVHFEVGQWIVASDTDGGALLDAGDRVQITAINRSTGVLTAAVDWDTQITGLSAGDFLYVEGDLNAKVTGFAGWLKGDSAAPGTLFGVNRNTDIQRLAGVYHDGAAETLEEALITAAAKLDEAGGSPDFVIVNPMKYADIIKSLGSKAVYDMVPAPDSKKFSVKTLVMATPSGEVRLVSDRNCPVATAYMLQMDTWKLYSLGEAPMIIDTDGNQWLRHAAEDAVEIRCGYYAQLACSAPGWNCKISL